MKYYLTIKKGKEGKEFAGKWVELENSMLSERIQIQKAKYGIYLLIC